MPARSRGYRLLPLAEADLEEIWLYTLENWSIEQADRYHGEIVDAFGELAAGSRAGRSVDTPGNYLKYAIGSHFIFYRRSDSGVVVVRILHRRMDAERHL